MIVVQRIPRGLRAPLVAALALVVLLASFGAALRQDPFAFLFPFGRGPGLDYSHGPTGLVPLDDRFISDILGEDQARPASVGPTARSATTPQRSSSLVDPHPLNNDDMTEARHVSRIPYTARTDARDATREPAEPATACGGDGGTIWYRYTARDEGALVATVALDSAFTAEGTVILGVFERERLEPVACDSDRGGRASVQVETEPGVTYLFQITGAGPLVFALQPPPAMRLISTNDLGEPGNVDSINARVSGDGRYVTYESYASDIVPGADGSSCLQRDPSEAGAARTGFAALGNCAHILVHDRVTGETVVASSSSDGAYGNGGSRGADISVDGRFVVYESWATNLVPGDTNRVADIFLHDLVTRETERISINSRGEQTLGATFEAHSFMATVSDDGSRIAFASAAPNLVDDIAGRLGLDVYVRDRTKKTTELVSVPMNPSDPATTPERLRDGVQTPEETPLYDEYMLPCISPDGGLVAFRSHASDLVVDDTNGYADWFVRDLEGGRTERISVASDGTQGNGHAGIRDHAHGLVRGNCFSADNRFVVFESEASNLVEGDTNGRGDGFVHDRRTGSTVRVTLDPVGGEFSRESHYTTISRDGRWIAFLGSDAVPLEHVVDVQAAVPGGLRVSPFGGEDFRPRGPHLYDMRTGRVEWLPLVSGQRTGEGMALDLSSDGRILTLHSSFMVFTEDPDHPSRTLGCTDVHEPIYERLVGEGCVASFDFQIYLLERWRDRG